MININKTIHKFIYNGKNYEIDLLTDATSLPNQMVCDIFLGRNAEIIGQIIVKKSDSKKRIEKIAIEEIKSYEQKEQTS